MPKFGSGNGNAEKMKDQLYLKKIMMMMKNNGFRIRNCL